ncbi:hypothetical protein ACIRST_09610 [Kitasatospora sp. NPDC101447]|uniref:hypothetical protein n=1 Tax=Kitasatospora sp. NPDC101447 TaxID=3364102 RepID=UPI0038126DBB
MTWVVRCCAVGAWAAMAVALVRAFGLGSGAVQPQTGLLLLGWVGLGLLWLRLVALWTRAALRAVARARSGRVLLSKQPPRREPEPRVPESFHSPAWVYVRYAAVWVLVPLAAAVPASLRGMDGGESVRQLKQAGAVTVTATVVDASGVEEIEDEGEVTGYHADLVLAIPGGPQVAAYGVTHDEPRPDGRVRALWAPSAPQLGAVVNDTKDLDAFVHTGWTWHVESISMLVILGLFVGLGVVPLSVAAGADGLHDLTWRPLAQSVNTAVLTLLFLWIRPLLTAQGLAADVAAATAVGFGIVLLFLYLGQSLRALSVS